MQQISGSEMEVMQVVWSSDGPVTSAQIQEALAARNWKATTVLTFLARLCEKGFLRAEKQGKANLYTPCLSEGDYRRQETRAFLDEVHHGSVKSFIAALADAELSPDDLHELKKWFEQQ